MFTLVETEVLNKLARLIGGAYSEVHDGLFVPGGSIANVYGTQPSDKELSHARLLLLHTACSHINLN